MDAHDTAPSLRQADPEPVRANERPNELEPLRALVVEHAAADVWLIERALRQGGYRPHLEVVEDAPSMRTALADHGPWDVVLSDYYLPRFDARQALEVLRSTGQDLPFIVVSGSIGEEVAVEVMRAGVHDYVMKENLTRLVPAIRREVREAVSRRERRRVEAALRASQARFRRVFETGLLGIFTARLDGTIVEANRAVLDLLGYAAEDVAAGRLHWRLLVHDPHRAPGAETVAVLSAEAETVAALFGSGTVEPRQRELVRRDGTPVVVLLGAARVEDTTTDQPHRVVCFVLDISERVRSEQRLQFLSEASALLAGSLEAATMLEQVAQLTVPTVADWCLIVLRHEDGTLHPSAVAHRDPSAAADLRALLDRAPLDPAAPLDLAAVVRDQRTAYVPAVAAPASAFGGATSFIAAPLAARGRVLGGLLLAFGAGQRRYRPADVPMVEELARRCAMAIDNARLFAAEQHAHQTAQAAVRARDEFLSIAAHELRTPVTGLRASAQLLQRAYAQGAIDPPRLERMLRNLDASSSRLARLANELLDVSRFRMGQLELQLEPLDLLALVQAALQQLPDEPGERHHSIELRVAPELGRAPLLGDPLRLDQVVLNLLDNAQKYSPDGGAVTLHLAPEGGGFLLSVADQGLGLPPGAQETIFAPFGRAPNASQRHLPGMGLGLYICRSIVERHGGRIWATSPGENRGTTISIWLPAAAPPPSTAGSPFLGGTGAPA